MMGHFKTKNVFHLRNIYYARFVVNKFQYCLKDSDMWKYAVL